MTNSSAEIVTADDMADATREWVTSEAAKVGDRYFEIAKFLFGVSAGSFAVIPFLSQLGGELKFASVVDFIPLAALATSALLAILMALPIEFEVNHKVNIVAMHRIFIRTQRRFILLWLVFWIFGILLLFFKATESVGMASMNG